MSLVAILALAGSLAAYSPSAGASVPPTLGSTAAASVSVTGAPEPSPTSPVEATSTPAGTPDPNATPAPTPIDLRPFLTSEVTVVNLGDGPLSVRVAALDPDSGDEYELGTFEIAALQLTTQSVFPALVRLEFGYAGEPLVEAGTCTIEIAEDEAIQFAVLEAGAVIAASAERDAPSESVATSPRCGAGGDA